jgi:hypothetical protein
MRITPLEKGHKIQLPADWAAELGLENAVELEKTTEGILVRSYSVVTWDDVFAQKLPLGSNTSPCDIVEVSGDDLLF